MTTPTQRVEHLARKTLEVMMGYYEPGPIGAFDRLHLADFLAACISKVGEMDESYTAFEIAEAIKFIREKEMVRFGNGAMIVGINWYWTGYVNPVLISMDHRGRVSHFLVNPDTYFLD